jgi:hypothetical protein
VSADLGLRNTAVVISGGSKGLGRAAAELTVALAALDEPGFQVDRFLPGSQERGRQVGGGGRLASAPEW